MSSKYLYNKKECGFDSTVLFVIYLWRKKNNSGTIFRNKYLRLILQKIYYKRFRVFN